MKHGIASILLALYLFPAQLFGAAEFDSLDSCVGWLALPTEAKTFAILGWLRGIEAADAMTSETIMPQLWPSGHRVGSVRLELDVECWKRENRNRAIPPLLIEIARRLNGFTPDRKTRP